MDKMEDRWRSRGHQRESGVGSSISKVTASGSLGTNPIYFVCVSHWWPDSYLCSASGPIASARGSPAPCWRKGEEEWRGGYPTAPAHLWGGHGPVAGDWDGGGEPLSLCSLCPHPVFISTSEIVISLHPQKHPSDYSTHRS